MFDVAARRRRQLGPPRRIEFSRFDHHLVTIDARYDAEQLLQEARVRVGTSSETKSERHVRQRLHTIDDITAALRDSGLDYLAMHDSEDVKRPAELADSVTFIARRTDDGPNIGVSGT